MARNEVKDTKGTFRRLVSAVLRVVITPRFLKTSGLLSLFFFFVIASSVMASSNEYYKIKDCDNSVIFSINNGPNFLSTNSVTSKPKYITDGQYNSLLSVRTEVKDKMIWDATLFPKLRDALGNDPWVESVPSIVRMYPHFVRIALKLREPYVNVEWNGRKYFVDKNSILLPIQPDADIERHLVNITGVKDSPPTRAGDKWESSYVEDCVGLIDFVTANMVFQDKYANLFAKVERMECAPASQTAKTGKPTITIRLIGGGSIVWDMYFTEEFSFGRPSREKKLQNLKAAMLKIDDLNTVEILDLSYDIATVKYKGSGDVR